MANGQIICVTRKEKKYRTNMKDFTNELFV